MKTQLRVLSAILTLLLNKAMLPKNPSGIFYHLKQNFRSASMVLIVLFTSNFYLLKTIFHTFIEWKWIIWWLFRWVWNHLNVQWNKYIKCYEEKMVILRLMTLYKDLKFRRKTRLILFEKINYTHIINNCLVTLSIYYYTPRNKFGRGV